MCISINVDHNLSAIECICRLIFVFSPQLPIFVPVIFLLISLYLTITPFIKAPFESSMSVVLILTGVPVYYIFIHRKAIPKCVLRCLGEFIHSTPPALWFSRYPDQYSTAFSLELVYRHFFKCRVTRTYRQNLKIHSRGPLSLGKEFSFCIIFFL